MYCRNCDAEIANGAVICVKCGMQPLAGDKFCNHCGNPTPPGAIACTSCGMGLRNTMAVSGDNKKLMAGLLGIFLGAFGVHKFVLGYSKEGTIMLVGGLCGFLTFGITSGITGIVGLIEGIMYLTKSDAEFEQTYVLNKKPWF